MKTEDHTEHVYYVLQSYLCQEVKEDIQFHLQCLLEAENKFVFLEEELTSVIRG